MNLLRAILLFLTAASLATTLLGACCTRLFFRRRTPVKIPGAQWPPLSIVKPVAAVEGGHLDAFSTFCEQDYPTYEIVFAFPSSNRALVPLLEELKRRYPEREIRWVKVRDNKGPNYKVLNLMAAEEEARYPILLFSDSDIRVGPGFLKAVVSELMNEKTGLVTCLYVNSRIRSLFSALRALTVRTNFIPDVLLDRRLQGLSYGFGAALCTRREILERSGGLKFLLQYLADDYEMGFQIRKRGYRIGIPPLLLEQVSEDLSFRSYVQQALRAAITYKFCRPLGYRLSILTQPLFFSSLFLLLDRSAPAGLLFLAVCGVRILSFLYVDRTLTQSGSLRRYAWLVPPNDLVNTVIWFLSLFLNTVHWKGRSFKVMKGGRMAETSVRRERYVPKTEHS